MMAEREPKTGQDFIQLARKSDRVVEIREGKGSHAVVKFDDGTSVSVPIHGNKQLGKGMVQKLKKAFKAAGVLVLILLILWVHSPWFPFP
jgi:hypothetical protein